MAHPPHTARLLLCLVLSVTAALFAFADPGHAQRWGERHSLGARQQTLLGRELAHLKAAEPRRAQLYFVGFAGFGGQAVFKREVLAVRELFDARFGTEGRSIALVNHPSTADQLPLASVGNLEAVLQHVGQLMDRRRDTLFLFLSSHGEPGLVAVEMPGVPMSQLRPQALKRMLERSGIKRRVIVVSSCHSGSFIPALADPSTLVIAASRADRSSFGCEDRRAWTYFGDAYFNQALRKETSFRAAFDKAKRTIADWEARDRLTPSLPQIAGGEALDDVD
jgi:hypothetical protein